MQTCSEVDTGCSVQGATRLGGLAQNAAGGARQSQLTAVKLDCSLTAPLAAGVLGPAWRIRHVQASRPSGLIGMWVFTEFFAYGYPACRKALQALPVKGSYSGEVKMYFNVAGERWAGRQECRTGANGANGPGGVSRETSSSEIKTQRKLHRTGFEPGRSWKGDLMAHAKPQPAPEERLPTKTGLEPQLRPHGAYTQQSSLGKESSHNSFRKSMALRKP